MADDPIERTITIAKPIDCPKRGDGSHNPDQCEVCCYFDSVTSLHKAIKAHDATMDKDPIKVDCLQPIDNLIANGAPEYLLSDVAILYLDCGNRLKARDAAIVEELKYIARFSHYHGLNQVNRLIERIEGE